MTILKLILEKLEEEKTGITFFNKEETDDEKLYNARKDGYYEGLKFAIDLIKKIIKEMREDK